MVAYADLVLPDTTYLERGTASRCSTGRSATPTAPADAIRQPVVEPDRDVRPFQDVLIDLGARLGLPGLVKEDGSPRYPGGYPDYIVNHERRPGIGLLAGWRGDGRRASGHRRAQPEASSSATSTMAASGATNWPRASATYQHANRDYLRMGGRQFGLDRPRRADRPAALQRAAAEVPPGRARAWRRAAAGTAARARAKPTSIRCRSGIAPFEEAAIETRDFPLHALTQRPMAMYHSWGSQNAWLRQIHGAQSPLHQPRRRPAARPRRRRLGLGRSAITAGSRCQVKADGRRQPGHRLDLERHRQARAAPGTWTRRRAEARKGFLLNHLISELLPPKRGRPSLLATAIRSPARPPGTICACGSRRPTRMTGRRASRSSPTLPLPPDLPKRPDDAALRRRLPRAADGEAQ